MSASETLHNALVDAVNATGTPGAVAFVGNLEEDLFFEAHGSRQVVPVRRLATVDTLYDLASLTKVVATATAVLSLGDEGALSLDEPATAYLPVPAFAPFTIRHLLTHTAGLHVGRPYYRETSSLEEMLQRYAEAGIDWEPGTRRRYSDVGFMILGRIVELVARDRLDSFCAKRIFRPLSMNDTTFNPPRDWADRCAATELCPWRKRVMVGEVHDENAYAVGGVAGHAGLFSSAGDLGRFCRALLGGRLLKDTTVEEMIRVGQVPCYPWQGLGWDLDPWGTGTAGYLPTRDAFGHAGWTGTCLWMDRKTGLFAILLGNTCHPTRSNRNNGVFRRTFFDAVAKVFYPNRSATHTGLDRLVREDFAPLRGRRVALLTHHAAVDQLGRHILEVLALAPDVSLQFVYAPEHGLEGRAEAGEAVPSRDGPVPVLSLMGKRDRPGREELAEIDYFVVDLQDVGARYYTYAATMKACLEACAHAKKPVLVLDRPNPIGGMQLEGPLAQRTDSPVCWGPVPVRHGMTLGEVAILFSRLAKTGDRATVMVLALDNWQRDRLFEECSLPWVAPSPNIPTPLTALVYVGACLFEATNLNEGRGTESPFFLVGAPWLDVERVLETVAPDDRLGCSLEAVEYTPQSLPGKATNPRHRDERCRGVRIHIKEPRRFRPFRLTVALIQAIRHAHPRRFRWQTAEWFDTLAGTPELRQRIERGEDAATITRHLERAYPSFLKGVPRRYG